VSGMNEALRGRANHYACAFSSTHAKNGSSSKMFVMGIRGRSAKLLAVATSALFNFPVCIMGSLVLPKGPLECHRSDPSVA
jgi:hypothetical protein